MKNGIEKLDKADFGVDYVISHCAPTNVQLLLDGRFKADILTNYFQDLQSKLKFKRWFFGHYHMDKEVNENFVCTYDGIIPIDS